MEKTVFSEDCFYKRYNIEVFVFSFFIMLFCAGSSPIIQYLSPDSSIFFLMGRAAANGKVLYRDVADHKGFYLFAFNWLGAKLAPNSMLGLFFVEVAFAYGKMFFLYKIARLYLDSTKKAIVSAMIFMAIATNFLSWNAGNLGEQFALFFQIVSVYFMCRYANQCITGGEIQNHPARFMYYHGMTAGVVFFIQANLVAMWIPFGIVLAYALISHRKITNFFVNLAMLLLGVFTVTVPVALYGVIYKCLDDMYYVMFEINFLYSKDGRSSGLVPYMKAFIISPSFMIVLFAIIGIVIASRYYKKRLITVGLASMLIVSVLFMSVSYNANPIYYTVYMPFMIPFCIVGANILLKKEKWYIVTVVALFVVTVFFNMQLMKKVFHLGTSGYAYESAYAMGELIDDKNANVLVLGNSLYYNCTGTLPHIRYFTIFVSGLSYETFPYCIDEQFDSLCSCENKYVMIQFMDDSYTFWNNEERDREMKQVLDENYLVSYEYNNGGIHSALYQKAE